MRRLTCFAIIPSNHEEKPTQLVPDNRRGLVEKPSSYAGPNGEATTVDFNVVYEEIIRAALQLLEIQCQGVKIECLRGVDIKQAGDILNQLLPHICTADITITDVTTHNPNVFLEYGIRLAVKDQLNIIIAHEGVKLPFNIETQRCIRYSLDLSKANKANQEIANYVKSYIEPQDDHIEVEHINLIKRNVDVYSGRKREQDMIKAFNPAPHLVADLAGFLLTNGNDPELKQRTFKFLREVGEKLEKDDRGQERAITHYKMMSAIKGLKVDMLEEVYVKLAQLFDLNPETKECAALYRDNARKLGEQ
jgi:hypothetical protein